MRKSTIALAFAVLLGGLVAAPALYADDHHGSMMGNGMMNQMMGDKNNKDNDGMMGDMMGMMKMMKQMSQMMDHCNNMMSDSQPNEQWRKNAPSQPEKKG